MDIIKIEEIKSSGTHAKIYRLYKKNNTYIEKKIYINLGFFNNIKIKLHSYICEYFPSKLANYVKSYRVEQNFYKNYKPEMSITIPKIYKIENNNLEFTIIMQDIKSYKKKYRNIETIKFIIYNMNKFYEYNKNSIPNYEIWNLAGYWNGNKKNSDKIYFKERYNMTIDYFKKYFPFSDYDYNNLYEWVIEMKPNILEYYKNNNYLIHGDLKLENLFKTEEDKLIVFDFQWFGYGSVETDISYLLLTSLSDQFLDINNIIGILNYYIDINKNKKYNLQKIYANFKLAACDFFEYLISCKWYNMTIDKLEENDNNKKDGLHVRKLNQIEKIFNIMIHFSNENL